MRKPVNFTFALLFLISFLITGSSAITRAENDELSKSIQEMYERHHIYRNKIMEIARAKGPNSAEFIANEDYIEQTDQKNLAQAKEVFETYGLPTISEVGTELAGQFAFIIQHCNSEPGFQLIVLQRMDELLTANEVSKSDYATLTDRVRLNMGMTQIYGTQLQYNEAINSYEPFESENPEMLNQLRKEMNLEPMEFYIENSNKKYVPKAKRK